MSSYGKSYGVVLPLLWNKMCTCESLVKKLWGIANLFPIAFPSKEGPRKGKVAKRNPPRGGSFLSVFLFLGNGKQTGKFQMESCSYHWGAVT